MIDPSKLKTGDEFYLVDYFDGENYATLSKKKVHSISILTHHNEKTYTVHYKVKRKLNIKETEDLNEWDFAYAFTNEEEANKKIKQLLEKELLPRFKKQIENKQKIYNKLLSQLKNLG